MSNLFVLGHGDYTGRKDFHLSDSGLGQMLLLSGLVKQIADSDIYVVSSPETVAIESAIALAAELKANSPEESLDLWSGGLAPEGGNKFGDPERAYEFLMSRMDRAASLVAVTHSELRSSIPDYVVRIIFGQKNCGYISLRTGEMVNLDFEKRTFDVLP